MYLIYYVVVNAQVIVPTLTYLAMVSMYEMHEHPLLKILVTPGLVEMVLKSAK